MKNLICIRSVKAKKNKKIQKIRNDKEEGL